MIKIRIMLQNNNKCLDTEIEGDVFDAVKLYRDIQECEENLVPVGNVLVTKFHIESIYEITEDTVDEQHLNILNKNK